MNAVETHGLTKRFGSLTAVDGVSLRVDEGDRYALVGPNGSGKTTFIKMLVGLLLPSAGSAQVYGQDVVEKPLAVKENIGYVSDDPEAYEYLTGYEFLTLTGRLRGMTGAKLDERIEELASMFPLHDVLPHTMSGYSRGNRQKVAFLASILTKPKLLIIDEPIVGLDQESIDTVGRTIVNYAKAGNTVFFVTHILSFAKTYASAAGIMKKGKIVKELHITAKTPVSELL